MSNLCTRVRNEFAISNLGKEPVKMSFNHIKILQTFSTEGKVIWNCTVLNHLSVTYIKHAFK